MWLMGVPSFSFFCSTPSPATLVGWLRHGQSGHLVDTVLNTRHELKLYIDGSSEHTPINFSSRKNTSATILTIFSTVSSQWQSALGSQHCLHLVVQVRCPALGNARVEGFVSMEKKRSRFKQCANFVWAGNISTKT